MRISDRSSEVCSSDRLVRVDYPGSHWQLEGKADRIALVLGKDDAGIEPAKQADEVCHAGLEEGERSEERRVGKACVRTCRSRRSPAHSKQNRTRWRCRLATPD